MRALLITGYSLATAAALVISVAAYRTSTRVPSFGEVISRMSAHRTGRVVVMLCWWWVGWHFFVR
jgi:Family of unknown function (DUF6186)